MIQHAPGAGDDDQPHKNEEENRYLPARMINELVYCPRLFYLMHVEGQFEHNAETTDGLGVHRRVDERTDALATPPPTKPDAASRVDQQRLFPEFANDAGHSTNDHDPFAGPIPSRIPTLEKTRHRRPLPTRRSMLAV